MTLSEKLDYIDVHAHYDENDFNEDRTDLLRKLHKTGAHFIINSGSDIISSKSSIKLAEQYEFIFASVGIFPLEANNVKADWQNEVKELAKHKKVIAIGEIGLDYHDAAFDFVSQKEVFKKQLQIAIELDLPVVIHDREADEDILDILKEYPVNGMIHRFFSKEKYGKEFLDKGFYIGIGPAITYSNATDLIKVVREMPIERMLFETDCPFLPTKRYEGQRADSGMIPEVIRFVADIRGIDVDYLAKKVLENTYNLFKF